MSAIDSLIDAWKRTDAGMRARETKRVYNVKYRSDNKDKLADYYVKNKTRILNRQSAVCKTVEGRAKLLWRDAKQRAITRQLEFSLPLFYVTEILELGTCERTGIPFNFDKPPTSCRVHPWGPSVDRIDNSRGYVIGNVQIVCNAFNLAKNDFPEHVIYALAQALVTYKSMEN